MSLQPWFKFSIQTTPTEEDLDDLFLDSLFGQDDFLFPENEEGPTRNVSTLSPELQKLVDESSHKTGWIF